MNDLICMMLQIGASDPSLRRELGSIKYPTLINFNEKIEGYEQARKTESSTAYGLATKGSPQKRSQSAQPARNAQKSTQNHGGNERSRRTALRGRCFRCARDDQMLPQCSYPATVKCNTCNNTGHISPAYGKRQVPNASNTQQSHPPASPLAPQMQQLAIGYDGLANSSPSFSHIDGASSANWGTQSNSSRAGAFYAPSSRPTPGMPL